MGGRKKSFCFQIHMNVTLTKLVRNVSQSCCVFLNGFLKIPLNLSKFYRLENALVTKIMFLLLKAFKV